MEVFFRLKETNSSAGKHKVISASVSMIPNIPELRISSQVHVTILPNIVNL